MISNISAGEDEEYALKRHPAKLLVLLSMQQPTSIFTKGCCVQFQSVTFTLHITNAVHACIYLLQPWPHHASESKAEKTLPPKQGKGTIHYRNQSL